MSYLTGLLRCEIPLEEHEKADLRAWLATLKSDCDAFGETPEDVRRMAAIRSKLGEK